MSADRETEFLAPRGDFSKKCPPLELSKCAMISASIAPAFVVHDTRTIPHSAWGRKARSECPAKCPQFAYASFRYFAGDPEGKEGGDCITTLGADSGAPTVGACPASTPNRRETSSPHGSVILRQTHAPQTVMYKEYTPVCVGVIFLV